MTCKRTIMKCKSLFSHWWGLFYFIFSQTDSYSLTLTLHFPYVSSFPFHFNWGFSWEKRGGWNFGENNIILNNNQRIFPLHIFTFCFVGDFHERLRVLWRIFVGRWGRGYGDEWTCFLLRFQLCFILFNCRFED